MKLTENTDYVLLEKGTHGGAAASAVATKEYVFIFPGTVGEFNAGMLFLPNTIKTVHGPLKVIREMLAQEYADMNDFHEKMKGLFKEAKRKCVFELATMKKFKIHGFIGIGVEFEDSDNLRYFIGAKGKDKAKLKAFYGK